MILNYSALLDLKGNSSLDNIRCVIGDGNVYRLNVLVALSGQIVDLTGHTARITFVKPDGHIVWQNMTIDDATSGSMYCVFENQVYAVEGTVQAEIELYDNGTNRLTTATFTLTARRGLLDDSAVESSSEYTALDDALQSVQGFDSIKSEIVTARGSYASLGDRLTALDNMQIGGRNYLRNGDFLNAIYFWKYLNSPTYEIISDDYFRNVLKITTLMGASGFYNSGLPLLIGKTYTISFWVKSDIVGSIYLQNEKIDVSNRVYFNTETSWTRYSVTFVTNQNTGAFCFYSNAAMTFYLADVKVELGTKATDWSPAPEDVTAYTDSTGAVYLGTTINIGTDNIYTIPQTYYASSDIKDGTSFRVKINKDSTGAVKLRFNPNSTGAPLYDRAGVAVTNLKTNAIILVTASITDNVLGYYLN